MKKKNVLDVEVLDDKNISPITTDFGREDLNELRDKINELIKG